LDGAADGVTAVVHLAALTHSRASSRYEAINVRGTQNLLEAARVAGVRRFLFISTRAIAPEGGAYSRSKRAAEEAVRASGLDWTIVRLPEVYGAGGDEGVDSIVARARLGDRIPVVGRGDDVLCPALVDDVIPACVRALESPQAVRRSYTLAGPCLTVREFVDLAAAAFGRRPRLIRVPAPAVAALSVASRFVPLPVYPDQLARLRSSKPAASPEAETDLEFRPRSLRDGLAVVARRDAASQSTQNGA
jgi:NADH dehydrogenase